MMKLRGCLKAGMTAIASAVVVLGSVASPAQADVIYQAFNVPFLKIQDRLPRIKALGYTHIQVSPPQLSHPSRAWWARYQPVDFRVIDSPLGNEAELKQLIDRAHSQNLKIIIDVVLNHMANDGWYSKKLRYPRFSPLDFHPKTCITDYKNRREVMLAWIGRYCDLPDLKTESPYVRQEAKNYLTKLVQLGADGFRFDAAKHIEPEFFQEVLQVVPPDRYSYGEVIGETFQESAEYTPLLDLTDFHLLRTMLEAFKPGGDLRTLINPADAQKALRGVNAVTFARCHDSVEEPTFFNFPTLTDAMLGNAYILAIQEGFPFIFHTDAENSITQAGVQFHERMMGSPQFFRRGYEIAAGADSPNLLFIERGKEGLAIINKSDAFFDVKTAKMPGLEVGCYQELQFKFKVSIEQGGDGQKYVKYWGTPQRGGIKIGPKTALFLLKTSRQQCQN